MTDSFRTRIAAAIESIRIQRDGDAVQMADAVIRELAVDNEDQIDIEVSENPVKALTELLSQARARIATLESERDTWRALSAQ